MAVYTEESVKSNIRVKNGKRVFYLAEGDHLTPSAREWLRQERIEILPAAEAKPAVFRTLQGAALLEKPEHMTHLRADVLVRKDHPRIVYRGAIDTLEAEILLTAKLAADKGNTGLVKHLEEILTFVRSFIRCDVLEEPMKQTTLCGLSFDEIRKQSHEPQKYYGQPHFMPDCTDSGLLLQMNKLRTVVRQTELATYCAFQDRDGTMTRPDLIEGMNRLSSYLWIVMIRLKKEQTNGRKPE